MIVSLTTQRISQTIARMKMMQASKKNSGCTIDTKTTQNTTRNENDTSFWETMVVHHQSKSEHLKCNKLKTL